MEDAMSIPSGFKYFVGAAALFIAGCSAYFSVRGLGMLFVGSATAVMIMAASLEVGKLVAASFLYRYWRQLSIPLRFYLTVAVLVLIGITSLGNYGYLARAYEHTQNEIKQKEGRIASLQKEIADKQRIIADSQNRFGKITDAGREDVTAVRQRITQAGTLLDQSLARLQEQRKTVQTRRDHDVQTLSARLAEQAEVLKKAIASEDAAIGELNQQLAVLDRAVDAYTKLGGPGLFKADGVKRGQELREQQRAERESIAAKVASHRERQEQLRAEHAKRVEAADKDIATVRDAAAKDNTKLDAEEQVQRKANADALAQIQTQLAALESKGQTIRTEGDTALDTLHQSIRSLNEQIDDLQDKIAATDIGSYRFVARAFDAGADSVVKWLILALVIVFDPLAVCLAVGFNVAILRERREKISAPQPPTGSSNAAVVSETITPAANAAAPQQRRSRWMTSLLVVVALAGGLGLGSYWAVTTLRQRAHASHSQWIPADSFAVITLRPSELTRNASARNLADWLGKTDNSALAPLLACVNGGGFDPGADVYLFAKFPGGRTVEKNARPVILCGLVAQVAQPDAAEATLSGIAEQMNRNLRPAHGSTVSLTRNRAMIQHGQGRYMDPEGGFFTFAMAGNAAVMLVEFEGNPKAPSVETEIRHNLLGVERQLPARSLATDGVLSVWFDSNKFFRAVPKNPAAEARYQQLQRHLGFDLVLNVRPAGFDKLNITADYAYQVDRFGARQQKTAAEVLTAIGNNNTTGIAGRLMDRCADTLDYDSLIERLRAALGGNNKDGIQAVVVEKSVTDTRGAKFVLTARCDAKDKAPLMAAVQTLWQ
jgi:hypothetical protein